ncbi:hypothetical protein ACIRST_12335 [Kitasatospora sp. NPDC101447]|uniref:hypothetical protein n=1 Tax=Kitasatospora sp. NPDC101447 TaxID=3364102 RepID=UPI0038035549
MARTVQLARIVPLPRSAHSSRSGRATALGGVLLLLSLQGLAVGLAPGPLRLFLSGALIGSSVAGLLLTLLLATSRQRAGATRTATDPTDPTDPTAPTDPRHRRGAWPARATRRPPGEDDTQWFNARSLEGFPMEQVRPLLLAPGAPGLNRLYTAWMFATHGHDPQWIAHHLDLPARTARLLVSAARDRPSPRT